MSKSDESDTPWPVTMLVMHLPDEELMRRNTFIMNRQFYIVETDTETIMCSEHFSPMVYIPQYERYIAVRIH